MMVMFARMRLDRCEVSIGLDAMSHSSRPVLASFSFKCF